MGKKKRGQSDSFVSSVFAMGVVVFIFVLVALHNSGNKVNSVAKPTPHPWSDARFCLDEYVNIPNSHCRSHKEWRSQSQADVSKFFQGLTARGKGLYVVFVRSPGVKAHKTKWFTYSEWLEKKP